MIPSIRKYSLIALFILALPLMALGQEKKKAIYFYGDDCQRCQEVDKFFEAEKMGDQYDIRSIDVSGPYNMEYLNEFFDALGIKKEKRGLPVIFFDSKMLIGSQPIIDNFRSEMEAAQGADFPTPEILRSLPVPDNPEGGPRQVNVSLSALVLFGASLVDSISPCGFSVMLILLMTIVAIAPLRKAWLAGLMFSSGIAVSYFIMGLYVWQSRGYFSFPRISSLIVGIVIFSIGVSNFRDFFQHKKFSFLEIPKSWLPKAHSVRRLLKTYWGAWGGGILASFFLVPCTRDSYFIFVDLLTRESSSLKAISLILAYSLIFISPLIILSFLIDLGVKNKKIEELRKRKPRLLNATCGIVMLFIGGYMVYSWLV